MTPSVAILKKSLLNSVSKTGYLLLSGPCRFCIQQNPILQREVFKHFDEDSRPREDKIIHNKLTKPRRENISQQGHQGRKDRRFEFLKSVFVAFAILL